MPMHKGDVKTDPSNFISIFPIPIFENIVHDKVSTFIQGNAFLTNYPTPTKLFNIIKGIGTSGADLGFLLGGAKFRQGVWGLKAPWRRVFVRLNFIQDIVLIKASFAQFLMQFIYSPYVFSLSHSLETTCFCL